MSLLCNRSGRSLPDQMAFLQIRWNANQFNLFVLKVVFLVVLLKKNYQFNVIFHVFMAMIDGSWITLPQGEDCILSLNPFTPKSDQCQIYPAAQSPELL